MKMSGGPSSIYIKLTLVVLALMIALGTLFYTNNLVNKLQEKDKQIVELYAKGLEYVVNVEDNTSNLTFIFENIIKPIDFPIIKTQGKNDQVVKGIEYRNVNIDSGASWSEQKSYLEKMIRQMDEINKPIDVVYKDSMILGRIHYGDSSLIRQLRNYPLFQIIIASLFIIIGYISFSYIKRTEQGNIWVGMAKETAHQLGTPISSLMGWSEILKMSYGNPDKVLDISQELDNDLGRLNKITQRFSKIGSNPELKSKNIYQEIEKTINYFQRRLPQIGKNVQLTIEGNKETCAQINPELFDWVIENLIKNALDAIESKKGLIVFSITEKNRNAEVEVKDNGKGIDIKRRKDIFRPGYSTKRRGWGLGLSLSKRIVEEYHEGKIFVKTSSPEGTTFKIVLKK